MSEVLLRNKGISHEAFKFRDFRKSALSLAVPEQLFVSVYLEYSCH